MLHLAIICIVCAASAPSDSTAFNGQKKDESNISRNFDGGEQNVTNVSFPSVYNVNVVGPNSSDCAKPEITFFYDYFIKQYQNSKSNSCSIMERVPLGESKNLQSNVDFIYRKRNLLWTTDERRFKPKTLRPPVSEGCSCSNRRPFATPTIIKGPKSSRKMSLNLDFKSMWKKHKRRKQFGQAERTELIKSEVRKFEKCTLSPQEKKLFLYLKHSRSGGEKRNFHKANLDSLKVDDDLDLNKRIKKLVEQIAEENHRKKEHFEEGKTGERRESENENEHKTLKNEDELSPILNNIKKMFIFNKNNFNNRIVGKTKTVPVSSTRVRDYDPIKAGDTISSRDNFRTVRKTIRLRRNPHKSHNSNESNKSREPRYKNNLTGWSNPYSANFKASINFLYPQRSRKFFGENTKKRRWMKMRMRRNSQKKGLRHWPILQKTFEKLYNTDSRPTCRGRCSGSCRKPAASNKFHRSSMNLTGMSQAFSLKDDPVDYISEGLKDLELFSKILNSESMAHKQGESTTEYVDENTVTQPKVFPTHSIEAPLLEKQLSDEKLKIVTDFDTFGTGSPSRNYVGIQACNPLGQIYNQIGPIRYLKIRHILRNSIARKKIEDSKKMNILCKRKKRNGSKFSSAYHKNWRSAPLLCVPYIRKGQEDQLKYLIKVIQNMMGKPIPPKCDIFEQTKYKPNFGKRRFIPRDFGSDEEEANYPLDLSSQCNIPCPQNKFLQSYPPSNFFSSSNIPYEPVNVESFHESPPEVTSTISPSTTLSKTPDVVQLCQSPASTPKSVSTCIPISFPVMETSRKTDLCEEKVTSPESSSPASNISVTHSSQASSAVPVTSTLCPPAKTTCALQTNKPASTVSTSIAPNCTVTLPTPACTTTPAAIGICTNDTTSPPPPLPEPSTACTSGQRIQPSTVNSYVLQESESQSEKEGTSATSACKGEECTTMISHFSGAPSEEPPIQQSLEDQEPSETNSRDVCCADKFNPTAVRHSEQSNSESVGSQYRAPESNAGFKDAETYYPDYLSRIARSKNEETRPKLEMIQKLFGNEESKAAFHDKSNHHSKKQNSESKFRNHKKYSLWAKRFKDKYNRFLHRGGIHNSNIKSNPVKHQRTKSSEKRKFLTMKMPTGCSRQHSNVGDLIFSTPVYNYYYYFPPYDHQTQRIDYQSTENPQQLNSKTPLLISGGFHKDGGPHAYDLNPPPEQNENYRGEFTTKSLSMNYDVEPKEEVYLKRQKRSDDYYIWPETEYSDYSYDVKEPEGLPSFQESDVATWTPPSYDMFSELAEAVAQNENQGLEEIKLMVPEELNPTTKSSYFNDTISSNAITTTTTTNTSAIGTASNTNVTSTITTPETNTEANHTTETMTLPMEMTAPIIITGKTRCRCKSCKKSYERFSKHSGNYKNLVDSREDKGLRIEDFVSSEEIHGPTTLKSATIVRGQKKFLGKPSPKVYMKVFPDSYENDQGNGESTTSTTARTTETINIAKTTEQASASTRTDLRLQILAVCEGYLEVVKLIKVQNQTLGEDMDESLARYCENIISQNFNFQGEKPKKLESNEPFTLTTRKKDLEKASDANEDTELYEDFMSPQDSRVPPDEPSQDVLTLDNPGDIISKRKLEHNLISKNQSQIKRRRKKRRNRNRSSRHTPKLRKRIRRKEGAEEDSGGKGRGKEQRQLIRLLRKRKKALLSWLLNANDGIKPDDLQDTEYFDEEDLLDPESETSQYSGTIKPRSDETSYGMTQKNVSIPKETIYPVYAKDYGYESGGELIEVEVLWRQVNEKTHENKIFKNLSVLALLLTSTSSPKIKAEETKLVGDDSDLDSVTKWKKSKLALDVAKIEAETNNSNKASTTMEEFMELPTSTSGSPKKTYKVSNKSKRKNRTHTIISKPDPKSIVGAPTSVNKTHRKNSHKYGVAKDIFLEYSTEFLNYAVYILPVMFTILFLLCCLCCALQILKIQKGHKKLKKKKKKALSSEDTSESGTSEIESKKRKRESKRKRNPASQENYDNVHKKKSKTFWHYLKVYGKPSREMDEENDQTEKKKSFLGFLKGKRDESKPGYSSAPTRETDDEPQNYTDSGERKHYSEQYLTYKREGRRNHEKRKSEGQSEAAERRELIALLEELKKIETDHIEGKKEVKSVQVQYAIPEDNNPVLKPESQVIGFSYPYEKNVFGLPKGVCPFYNKKFQFHPSVPPSSGDYNPYEDVNELTKLLPWECYPQRNDFLKHCDIKMDQTDRCDRFLKIFRDSGMNCNRPIVDKHCKKNESESRSFIFNKYRSISVDKSEELGGVTAKISGAEVRLMENVSPYKLPSNRDEDLVEDVESLKCQLNKKKYVRLKDEGVLCRL